MVYRSRGTQKERAAAETHCRIMLDSGEPLWPFCTRIANFCFPRADGFFYAQVTAGERPESFLLRGMGPYQSLSPLLVWLRDGGTRHAVVRQVDLAGPVDKQNQTRQCITSSRGRKFKGFEIALLDSSPNQQSAAANATRSLTAAVLKLKEGTD